MSLAVPLRSDPTQPQAYYLSQPYHTDAVWYNPSPHLALDMIGYLYQPVYAAQSGRVFAAGWDGGGWAYGGGLTVLIDHFGVGKYAKTAYAHMSRLLVSRDQHVMRGQLIGYAGSTGNSSGPHLHFSVGVVKAPDLNPLLYYSYKWMDPRRFFLAHTYANGSQATGGLVNAPALQNTFIVNGGVNVRSSASLTSGIVYTTKAMVSMVYLASARGTSYAGSTTWHKLHDPNTQRTVYVHSVLGRLT